MDETFVKATLFSSPIHPVVTVDKQSEIDASADENNQTRVEDQKPTAAHHTVLGNDLN